MSGILKEALCLCDPERNLCVEVFIVHRLVSTARQDTYTRDKVFLCSFLVKDNQTFVVLQRYWTRRYEQS